jgi:hypothetical protein
LNSSIKIADKTDRIIIVLARQPEVFCMNQSVLQVTAKAIEDLEPELILNTDTCI